jgi:hypothetical protein
MKTGSLLSAKTKQMLGDVLPEIDRDLNAALLDWGISTEPPSSSSATSETSAIGPVISKE